MGRGGGKLGAYGPTFPCPRCGRPLRRKRRPTRIEIACPRCRFLIFDYPRPCAGMVVLKGDTMLLLRRGHTPRRGYLDLPGGFIEPGEGIERSARRELREETGLTVGKVEPLGMWWDDYDLPGFGPFPTMNFYFIARWRSGVPRAGDDAASAEWVPIARLSRVREAAWPHMREVFREVIRRTRSRVSAARPAHAGRRASRSARARPRG